MYGVLLRALLGWLGFRLAYDGCFCLLFFVAQDIENLTHSMETLSVVVEKFSRGRQSLAAMTPENEGKKCLVPITASVCSARAWTSFCISLVTCLFPPFFVSVVRSGDNGPY